MLVEDKENKISIVFNDKKLYFFNFYIPEGLVKSINVPKITILLNHSEPYKIKNIRGKVTRERLEKELKQEIKKAKK